MKRKSSKTLGWFVLAFAIALAATTAHQQGRGTTVTGEVKWDGEVPKPVMLEITKNEEHCGKAPRPSPRLVIGKNKGVANCVITIEGVRGAPPPKPVTATLDQEKCTFIPHVQVVPVGSTLNILSSDPILHNVHAYLGRLTLFNLAMPRKGMKIERKLTRPGIIELKCDAGHIWMSGYIHVVDHPHYALTDEDGSFKIEGVPPGKYKVRLWHEGWKLVGVTRKEGKPTGYQWSEPVVIEKEIKVPESGEVKVSFELSERDG